MVKGENNRKLILFVLAGLVVPQLQAKQGAPALAWTSGDLWHWPMWVLVAGLLIWNHFRGVRRKKEKRRLETEAASRISQIQRERRMLEQEAATLKALDAKKSAFFANISYELRTPLTLMMGPIHEVLERGQLEAQDEYSIRLANQHINKMLTMVNGILDLSKLDADQLKLEEEFVELYALAERLLDPFISLASARKIDFQVCNEWEVGYHYKLDAKKLERILSNLLFNALRSTTEEGWIQVRLGQVDHSLLVEVKDNGAGIAEADLPYVFDRYYRSERMDPYQVGGTSIGLALVKELSVLMGGEIKVQSCEGQGTQFAIRLPYQGKRQRNQTPASPPRLEFQAGQSTDFEQSPKENVPAAKESTILVVEDHLQMRQYICKVLGRQHDCSEASNGEEALALLEKSTRIDLVITDVMMDKMDGLTLLKRLKEHPEWKTIPVIMLTALANQDDRLKALDLGAVDYILKPFIPVELYARVSNILSQQEVSRQDRTKTNKTPELDGRSSSRSPADELWLNQLNETIKEQMGAFDFTIDRLGFHMAISRRQLSRKVKSLTGLTVHQYVQEIKLNEARRLLENQSKSTVKAIAYELGMKDVKHFSRLYLQRSGKRPSDFF
ncbi:MAG: response regulator [Saprospiraceae bacterium]|nr:response regulator [Saprospiraceae bacterium]